MKVKLCGLSRICDIEAANEIKPDYVGFVFAEKSKRYVSPSTAVDLKKILHPDIQAVGVFVNKDPKVVAQLLNENVIDLAQLHGKEDEEYIRILRTLTEKPVIQAFRITSETDVVHAQHSSADFILLDSGAGTGNVFDWNLIRHIHRPFFLAGGLEMDNVEQAILQLKPYAADVSSGIETNGLKDKAKMVAFVATVRKEVEL